MTIPGTLSISRASPEDAIAIAPLFRKYLEFYDRRIDDSTATAFLHQRLTSNQCLVFLAVEEPSGAPVGFVLVYPSWSSLGMRPCWILNDLFVTEPLRRTGVGRQLIRAVHAAATAVGVGSIQLETGATNLGAQRLYVQEGYQRTRGLLQYSREAR